MPGDYLSLEICEHSQILEEDNFEYRNRPFAGTDIFLSKIENYELKSCGNDVKEIYQIEFNVQELPEYDFKPGDSIGILPNNSEDEILALSKLLNIDDIFEKKYKIKILEDTKKKNAAIPKHIPPCDVVKNIFLKYIDIRSVPKKIFLKALIKYTTNPEEVAVLDEISAPKNKAEYQNFVQENNTLIDLFKYFKSCKPPIEIILEHSVPLQPRFYSITSFPLKNTFSIIFDVIKYKNLQGICSSFLKNCINSKNHVPMYFRKSTQFLFENPEKNNVLIATGTGIAPFISFLNYKKYCDITDIGDIWIYYGCRYKNKDNLCDNFENYINTGCLNKLIHAYSRENDKKYVQDKINDDSIEFANYIENGGKIYVCGNKNMEKSVKNTIIECLKSYKNIAIEESIKYFENSYVKQNRYIVDIWT